MYSSNLITLLTITSYLLSSVTAGYTLDTLYSGQSFLNRFQHRGINFDPTNGFVKYVDRPEAMDSGLVKLNQDGSVYLGVDHDSIAPNGRRSVRVQSQESFTQGLMIADIAHMPGSVCGTWPAFWLEPRPGQWPQTGEIDIIEGTNKQRGRISTTHLGPQHCVMDPIADLGLPSHITKDDCYTAQEDAAGCSIQAHNENTFGDGYNAAGGGFEVLLWTESEITMWFFPRNAPLPPTLTSDHPDPSVFGKPLARWTFARSGCDLPRRTQDLQIVFNIEMCGDWTNGAWGAQCAAETGYSSCSDFVANNPKAFANSYWKINSVKWFKDRFRLRRDGFGNETVIPV